MQLERELVEAINRIFNAVPEVERAVLFGSRATDHAVATSDIDLAVWGKNLSSREVNLIKNRFEEEIRTALKFDVVWFDQLIKEALRQRILAEGVEIYAR